MNYATAQLEARVEQGTQQLHEKQAQIVRAEKMATTGQGKELHLPSPCRLPASRSGRLANGRSPPAPATDFNLAILYTKNNIDCE